MPANTNPIFTITPKIAWGTIATANTAKDGTGTVVPIFTAGANGSYLSKVIVKALGTNIATVLRLFLNNGSANSTPANNTMFADVTVAATTNSEVAELADIEIPVEFAIPAGYVVNATIGTTIAAGLHLTGVGGDF